MRCEINNFTAFACHYHPTGVLWISSDRVVRMGAKIKTQKIPLGFKQNPKKSLDQNLSPQKSHAEFLTHKKFRKALNGITWKIVTLVLNNQKIPYVNQANQKMTPKFSHPKKSQNQKFETKKTPLVIPVTWNPELNTCTITHWPFEGIPFWS